MIRSRLFISGLSLASLAMFSCGGKSSNDKPQNPQKSYLHVSVATAQMPSNVQQSSNIPISTEQLANYTFNVNVTCPSGLGDGGDYIEDYVITEANSKLAIIPNKDCTLTLKSFTHSNSEFLAANNSTLLTLHYKSRDKTIEKSDKAVQYSNLNSNPAIDKYVNGKKLQDDKLKVYITNSPKENENEIEKDLQTIDIKTTSNELSVAELKAPDKFELKITKSTYNVIYTQSKTKTTTHYTIMNKDESITSWPENCKIVPKESLDPKNWTAINNAYKNSSSINCSDIDLSKKNNWKNLQSNAQLIILANSAPDDMLNSYRTINVPAF